MIRLNEQQDELWFEMPHGTRMRLRRSTAAGELAAQTARARYVVDRQNASREEEPGEADLAYIQALASRIVDAWEGFAAGPDDAPAPCTPETVGAVMRDIPGMAAAFRDRWLTHVVTLGEQKKSSASSPDGTSAKAPDPNGAGPAV